MRRWGALRFSRPRSGREPQLLSSSTPESMARSREYALDLLSIRGRSMGEGIKKADDIAYVQLRGGESVGRAGIRRSAPVAKGTLTEQLVVPQVEALAEKAFARSPSCAWRAGTTLSTSAVATKRADKVGNQPARKFDAACGLPRERLHTRDRQVNEDSSIHGCLMFRPSGALTGPLHASYLDPAKDVDCITTGSLYGVCQQTGNSAVHRRAVSSSSTTTRGSLDGAKVTVVGRSLVIGSPSHRCGRNATVTMCHTHTRPCCGLQGIRAIVVTAAGRIGTVEHRAPKPGRGATFGIQLGPKRPACSWATWTTFRRARVVPPSPRSGRRVSITTAVLNQTRGRGSSPEGRGPGDGRCAMTRTLTLGRRRSRDFGLPAAEARPSPR